MLSEATIRGIQNTMRKDVGVDGDAQRLGQLVWMLFLKILDDREVEWELLDPRFTSPLPEQCRWRNWAADPEGATGDSLIEFVNLTLFPQLQALVSSSDPLGAVVGEAFQDAINYMKSGTLLRQVVNRLNEDFDFNRSADREAIGRLYETMLRELQSAGNAGEYYTPRPVVDFMVEMVAPQLGERVLDPACGTGGFLTSVLGYVRRNFVHRPEDERLLQSSLAGIEKKQLPHLLCVTNLLMHGVDIPGGVAHTNGLARPLRDYGPDDRVDVILTNPPFRGSEADGIENNFPAAVRTRETADLFLALVLHLLKPGGRAAIVLPDSSLYGEGVKETLRKRLLDECDLHTIVRLPHGVFSPYTDIRTNVLFFKKAETTSSSWFYEVPCPVGEKYTKTKPITDPDLDGARQWWPRREEDEQAWSMGREEAAGRGEDLLVTNPHMPDPGVEYARAVEARGDLIATFDSMRAEIPVALAGSDWPIQGDVTQFFDAVTEMAPFVPLTSGVMEELRRALTDLALRGQMSEPEDDDDDVEETIASYTASVRKVQIKRVTPPPFEIPASWSWQRLADLGEFQVGRTPSTKDPSLWVPPEDPHSGHPWVAIGDMPRRGAVTTTKKRITDAGRKTFKTDPIPANSLLVAFKLSVGKTALLGIPAFHNEAIASFQVQDEVLRAYLLWALPALVTHAAANPAIMGTTLNSKSLAALWVPVPPRAEQRRIVAALEWSSNLLATIADASESVRRESDRVIKLLAHSRALNPLSEALETPAESQVSA